MPGKRRTKGDGGLFKRADGLWIASVEVPSFDGKRRQKRVSAKSFAVAKRKLKELQDDIDQGIIVSSSTTVTTWLRHWLEEMKRPNVRPGTYSFYEESVRLHIVPRIGDKRLTRLTTEDVRGMLRGIPTSRNKQRAHQTLSLALKDAVRNGLLRRNVCEAVAKPKHVTKPRAAFTPDDAVNVMRTAIEHEKTSRDVDEPRLATRWIAAFFTGARQGELLGLEWNRVDLEQGSLDLSWQLQQLDQAHGCLDGAGEPTCGRERAGYCPDRNWANLPDGYEWRECYRSLVWTRPKSRSGTRIVPIVEPLLSEMRAHAATTASEPNPHGLVWRYPAWSGRGRERPSGRPVSPGDDHDYWTALLRASGVPHQELHAARHTTATILQRIGVPEEVRMKITGHSTAAAHAAYIHVDQTQTRAALDMLAAALPILDRSSGQGNADVIGAMLD